MGSCGKLRQPTRFLYHSALKQSPSCRLGHPRAGGRGMPSPTGRRPFHLDVVSSLLYVLPRQCYPRLPTPQPAPTVCRLFLSDRSLPSSMTSIPPIADGKAMPMGSKPGSRTATERRLRGRSVEHQPRVSVMRCSNSLTALAHSLSGTYASCCRRSLIRSSTILWCGMHHSRQERCL